MRFQKIYSLLKDATLRGRVDPAEAMTASGDAQKLVLDPGL